MTMTAREATSVKAEDVNWSGVISVLNPVIDYDPASPQALRRTVFLTTRNGDIIKFKEPLWPVWVPSPDSETSMADFEKQWADASAQARSTSKWLATVLGVALAALIGSAPLTNLRDLHVPWYAYVYGGVGLALVVLVLFLVLRVLVPQVTGFDDLTSGKRPFKELKAKAEKHCGVLLPTGITSLDELAGRAQLEARTLNQLAVLLAKVKEPDAVVSSLQPSHQAQGTRRECG
jgi:hypothetical protein